MSNGRKTKRGPMRMKPVMAWACVINPNAGVNGANTIDEFSSALGVLGVYDSKQTAEAEAGLWCRVVRVEIREIRKPRRRAAKGG